MANFKKVTTKRKSTKGSSKKTAGEDSSSEAGNAGTDSHKVLRQEVLALGKKHLEEQLHIKTKDPRFHDGLRTKNSSYTWEYTDPAIAQHYKAMKSPTNWLIHELKYWIRLLQSGAVWAVLKSSDKPFTPGSCASPLKLRQFLAKLLYPMISGNSKIRMSCRIDPLLLRFGLDEFIYDDGCVTFRYEYALKSSMPEEAKAIFKQYKSFEAMAESEREIILAQIRNGLALISVVKKSVRFSGDGNSKQRKGRKMRVAMESFDTRLVLSLEDEARLEKEVDGIVGELGKDVLGLDGLSEQGQAVVLLKKLEEEEYKIKLQRARLQHVYRKYLPAAIRDEALVGPAPDSIISEWRDPFAPDESDEEDEAESDEAETDEGECDDESDEEGDGGEDEEEEDDGEDDGEEHQGEDDHGDMGIGEDKDEGVGSPRGEAAAGGGSYEPQGEASNGDFEEDEGEMEQGEYEEALVGRSTQKDELENDASEPGSDPEDGDLQDNSEESPDPSSSEAETGGKRARTGEEDDVVSSAEEEGDRKRTKTGHPTTVPEKIIDDFNPGEEALI